ncbi:MAG: type II secretion system F family protein [Candidatus Omnitrophica bacterium]|nr:type II secretion system F family protein [Candidatus Omnitrophota bacterium]
MELFVAICIFLAVVLMIFAFAIPRFSYKEISLDQIERRVGGFAQRKKRETPSIIRQLKLSDNPFFDAMLKKMPPAVKVAHAINQAGLKVPLGKLIALIFILFFSILVIGVVFSITPIPILTMSLIVFCAPFLYIHFRKKRRLREFTEILPDALSMMANALRAGQGFSSALEMVANEMPDPVALEFKKTIAEVNLGVALEDAFSHLGERVQTPDVKLFVSAILLQREVGGNLAEFLYTLEDTVRQRFRLQRELKTLTAQSRLSGFVVGFLPFAVAMVLLIVNPEYMRVLITEPTGRIILFIAVFLQVVGILTIKKLVSVEL